MDDVNPRRLAPQHGQTSDHRLVDGMRALASPEHQHGRRAAPLGGNLEKRLPHRNSGHGCVPKIFRGLLKMHRRRRHESSHYPIGETRNNVRLKRQRGNMLYHRRQHRRPGSISAHADHHIGRKLVQHSPRAPDRPRQIERRLDPRHPTDVLQRPHPNQLQRISRRGHEPVLDAACRADEQHLGCVTFPELIGNGQRRDHVSARPATGQDCPHEVTITQRLGRPRICTDSHGSEKNQEKSVATLTPPAS